MCYQNCHSMSFIVIVTANLEVLDVCKSFHNMSNKNVQCIYYPILIYQLKYSNFGFKILTKRAENISVWSYPKKWVFAKNFLFLINSWLLKIQFKSCIYAGMFVCALNSFCVNQELTSLKHLNLKLSYCIYLLIPV